MDLQSTEYPECYNDDGLLDLRAWLVAVVK